MTTRIKEGRRDGFDGGKGEVGTRGAGGDSRRELVSKGNAPDLAELAGLVERGDVSPRMGKVFRFEDARESQDASQGGRAKGKILLKVA